MLMSLREGPWYLTLSIVNKKGFGVFFNPIKVPVGGGAVLGGGPSQGLGMNSWPDFSWVESRVIEELSPHQGVF